MNIQIDHVSLIVADVQKSLDFYVHLLGLEIDSSRPAMSFDGAWLKLGNQQIHLLQLPNPDPVEGRAEHGGRDRHLAFLVDDLAIYQKRLGEKSMVYTMSQSGRRALFCRDPDGNACELVERIDE